MSDVRIEIEKEKALFWPDFARLEKGLEQQLKNERLTALERLEISNKLTSLSFRWTESGIRDVSVVKAIRDNVARDLQMLRETDQESSEPSSVYDHEKQQLAKLDAILAEAQRKGIKSQINPEAA